MISFNGCRNARYGLSLLPTRSLPHFITPQVDPLLLGVPATALSACIALPQEMVNLQG